DGELCNAWFLPYNVSDGHRHLLDSDGQPNLVHLTVVGSVKHQDRADVLETLSPFGPAAGGVLALHCEDRRAVGRIPGAVDEPDLLGREVEDTREGGSEVSGFEGRVNVHGIV